MIYLSSSWRHPWLPGVYASDASESGYGVTYRLAPRETVADLGRVPERSRYRLKAGAARAHAAESLGLAIDASGKIVAADVDVLRDGGELAAGPGGIDADEASRWEGNPDVPEVPLAFLAQDDWREVCADRWWFDEGIIYLEARALVRAIERCATSSFGRDVRCLFLGAAVPVTINC